MGPSMVSVICNLVLRRLRKEYFLIRDAESWKKVCLFFSLCFVYLSFNTSEVHELAHLENGPSCQLWIEPSGPYVL